MVSQTADMSQPYLSTEFHAPFDPDGHLIDINDYHRNFLPANQSESNPCDEDVSIHDTPSL